MSVIGHKPRVCWTEEQRGLYTELRDIPAHLLPDPLLEYAVEQVLRAKPITDEGDGS